MDILSDVKITGNLNASGHAEFNTLKSTSNLVSPTANISEFSTIVNFCKYVKFYNHGIMVENSFGGNSSYFNFYQLPRYVGPINTGVSVEAYITEFQMLPKTKSIVVPPSCTRFELGRYELITLNAMCGDPYTDDDYLIYPIVTAYQNRNKVEMDVSVNLSSEVISNGFMKFYSVVNGSVLSCSDERYMKVSMFASQIVR